MTIYEDMDNVTLLLEVLVPLVELALFPFLVPVRTIFQMSLVVGKSMERSERLMVQFDWVFWLIKHQQIPHLKLLGSEETCRIASPI